MSLEGLTEQAWSANTADSRGLDCEPASVVAGNGRGTGKHGGQRLTPQQRKFVETYITSGGNSRAASKAAGYASGSYGSRQLCNPAILAEIKRLSVLNAEHLLPQLIARQAKIALDPETKPDLASKIGFQLMDRLGMKPKVDPLVQVNTTNNTDNSQKTVVFGGDEAQKLLADVWQQRNARLSGIPATITDTAQPAVAAPTVAFGDDPALALIQGQGGGHSQGPVARAHPIPPHVPTHEEIGEEDADIR